ncbi:hypothetical protein BS78_08G038500 [Paspalum vaginatum]|nr:hypothetical protein BS78_08G038500 [Paspalum vaginatum]
MMMLLSGDPISWRLPSLDLLRCLLTYVGFFPWDFIRGGYPSTFCLLALEQWHSSLGKREASLGT